MFNLPLVGRSNSHCELGWGTDLVSGTAPHPDRYALRFCLQKLHWSFC